MVQNGSNSGPHDRLLEQAVHDALDRYAPLRVWKHGIEVSASQGAVRLTGHARAQSAKDMAEELVRGVKGVSSVTDEIVCDEDLELAVAQALGADPRTRAGFPGILVGVVFGTVYLKGAVGSDELKRAASEVAGRVAGVRDVSNELAAPAPAAAAKSAPAAPARA